MTEDEAKTKWCPHAREKSAQFKSTSRNRLNEAYGQTLSMCIGSECMAWRIGRYDGFPPNVEAHGYCGLAGKP